MPPVFEPDFDPKRPLTGIWARFPHARRKIHSFLGCNEFIIFRPCHAPPDWWGAFLPAVLPMWRSNPRRLQQLISKRFVNFMEAGEFFRLFVLPDPLNPTMRRWHILWNPQIGYVHPQTSSDNLQGAYFQPQTSQTAPKNLWKTLTSKLIRHFEREWYDPTSDVRAALPWCDWTIDERREHSIHWEKGSLTGLTLVLEAALKYENTLWQEELGGFVSLIFGQTGLYIASALNNHQVKYSPLRHFPPRLVKLVSRLQELNIGFYKLPAGTRTDWHLPWAPPEPPRSRYRRAHLTLELSPPSQHEIVEASLFLRTWLIANAPDLRDEWFANA